MEGITKSRNISGKANSQKIIIFCQAPADIPYVLTLYGIHKNENSISIFVINVEGMFRFLSDLQLDLEQLVFIPYQLINLKRIDLLPAERKRIKSLWKKYFSNIQNGNVYFFSRFEDWLTAAFIHRFAEKSEIQITYMDHYDYSAQLFPVHSATSFKIKIYLLILKYLTKVNFNANIRDRLPEFQVDSYTLLKTKVELDERVFLKFAYLIDTLDKKTSNLLFFISSVEAESTIYDPRYFISTIIAIINLFRDVGFKIIVKGHPRTGLPKAIKEVADFEIPSYVPGEFIDTGIFKICLGIDTSALCYFAKNKILPTYSVIKLFPYVDNTLIEIFIQFLQKQSNNEILFIENFEELKDIALIHL
jgi:hypothetical protein